MTATDTGLVFAQNMMYQHTMTVYDAASGALVKTIPDSVDLAQFGFTGHPGISRGAPVEAAVDHVHRYMFATNYSMYGANFGPEGSDNCGGPGGLSPSYVYRVNLKTLAIDKVGQVGMVPKYVAVTPDDKYVLVSNWCSYDLSVLDYNTLHEVQRIHLGTYPRGIAVDGAKHVAYVAIMGSYDVARIDLDTFALSYFRGVGNSPRHLVLSNDGTRLFVTLNGDNRVVAVDTASGQVVARTSTGNQPRSMAISSDGRALYVVNYLSEHGVGVEGVRSERGEHVPGTRPSDRDRVRTRAPPRVGRVLQRRDPRLQGLSRGEVGLAARRQAVTDLETQREAEVLQLADVELERLRLPPEARGEIGGAHRGTLGDRAEHRTRPGAVRARPVETREPARDVVDLVGGEGRGRRERGAGIGIVGGADTDAIGRKLGRPAQLADELGAGRETSPPGVGIRDPVRVDDVDRVDHDATRRGAIRVPRDHLRSLPPPERERHLAVDDRLAVPGLDQHAPILTPDPANNAKRGRRAFG